MTSIPVSLPLYRASTDALPKPTAVSRPVVETVTIDVCLEVHCVSDVTSLLVPSEYPAVAVSCLVSPMADSGLTAAILSVVTDAGAGARVVVVGTEGAVGERPHP
jgi:hypothetical protein